MGTLLVRNHNKTEIARLMYEQEWDKIPDVHLLNRVRQHQLAICKAMLNAGYVLRNCSQEALVELLQHALYEVRPVIVPAYPHVSIDEEKRREEQKQQWGCPPGRASGQ